MSTDTTKSKLSRVRGAGYEAPAPVPKGKRRMGRPSDYEPWMMQAAARLVSMGATEKEVCEQVGVSAMTLWRWKQERPDFRYAIEVGKPFIDDRIEQSLLQRALGGVKRKTVTDPEGKVTTTIEEVPGSDRAQVIWLTNRRPDRWRNRQETELIVPIGDTPQDEAQTDVRKLALAAIALMQEAAAEPLTIDAAPSEPEPEAEEESEYDGYDETDEDLDLDD